ncbi:hypothetical protein [Halobaculum sp. D14]|uniref:hypothetical protein n=1 Tax=Halobaculum sp. D14 TaxID=3421642 RepID=UPI003EBC469E
MKRDSTGGSEPTPEPAANRGVTRRDALRRGAALGGAVVGSAGLAGCVSAPADALLAEGFESDVDWETAASIGPEEPLSAFDWRIQRSRAQAATGEWSLELFTEGDHDDGTAWATTTLTPPADASSFSVSLQAWSASESFNALRDLVVLLGPEQPTDESSFPSPGENTSSTPGAPAGGPHEPLHLADGWREYGFDWRPETVPETLHFAVGVSVIWEADAAHYVDDVEIAASTDASR